MDRSRRTGLLIAFAALAGGAVLLWRYQTDDTWIHLRYAHNLLTRGEYAFNPGDPTYGSTSPLWVFCLVLLMRFGLAPLAAARVLGLVFAAAKLLVADRLLARLPLPSGWRPWLLVLIATDAWFLRWSLSGMETPLAELLLLVLLGPVAASGPVAWIAWGATWGLGSLARPEIALLAPTALPWLLWLERRRHPGRSTVAALAQAALGWLLVVGPWLVYAQHEFGRFIPGTATAKSLAFTLDPRIVVSHLVRASSQLGVVQGLLWVAFLWLAARWLLSRRGNKAAGAGPVFGPRALAWAAIAATWLAVQLGGYALKQVWSISRYVSPLSAPLLIGLALLAGAMQRRLAPRTQANARRVLVAAALATMLANGALLTFKVRPYVLAFARGIESCFVGTGEWLRDHTPPDTVIAALDIGAVGYASGRTIFDLAGLVEPRTRALGRRMGFEQMVETCDWLEIEVPDYCIDRIEGPPRWDGRVVHGVRFELVSSCTIQGVGLLEEEARTYALYRLVPLAD